MSDTQIERNPVTGPAIGSGRAGVLLSGIGGWEVGLEMAGWQVDWSCEQDAGKRALLERASPRPCYQHSADAARSASVLPDGLLVIGGLQDHSMEDHTWHDCLAVIDRTRPRWVVLETVHTIMLNRWPQSFTKASTALHSRGYTTLWFFAALGSQTPNARWTRLFIVGWPIGTGIPSNFARMHGQVLSAGDRSIALNGRLGQVYPDESNLVWTSAWGFPDQWIRDDEPWDEWLRISSAPRVTAAVAQSILLADQDLMKLLEDSP
jgi:site-specific DNA-cytosine methylase